MGSKRVVKVSQLSYFLGCSLTCFLTLIVCGSTAFAKLTEIKGDERERYQGAAIEAVNKVRLVCSGAADPVSYIFNSSEVFVDKAGVQPALIFHYNYRPSEFRIVVKLTTTSDFKNLASLVIEQQAWRRTYGRDLLDPIPQDGFVTDVTVTCQPSPLIKPN